MFLKSLSSEIKVAPKTIADAAIIASGNLILYFFLISIVFKIIFSSKAITSQFEIKLFIMSIWAWLYFSQAKSSILVITEILKFDVSKSEIKFSSRLSLK